MVKDDIPSYVEFRVVRDRRLSILVRAVNNFTLAVDLRRWYCATSRLGYFEWSEKKGRRIRYLSFTSLNLYRLV